MEKYLSYAGTAVGRMVVDDEEHLQGAGPLLFLGVEGVLPVDCEHEGTGLLLPDGGEERLQPDEDKKQPEGLQNIVAQHTQLLLTEPGVKIAGQEPGKSDQ